MIAKDLLPYEAGSVEFENIINAIPGTSIWILKISMMILPLICILIGFILYHKKFKIDEKLYAEIVADLEERNNADTNTEIKIEAENEIHA
jgi:Na+/melibiose symporter-like transporter